jgi:2,3-dimethylmalate lyase
MNPRKKLRELLAATRYVVVPGAYDTLTARLVQGAGFDAVYLTGGGYSRANGYPADMDAGYGNALNVIRSVREYEKTGVAAFHLEDQVSPKKCGHYEGKQVVSRAEMVGKIKAAVDTRRDADMVIIARSDARAIEGLQASIDRVCAYLEAGARQHLRRRQDPGAAGARAGGDGLPHRHLSLADASRGDYRGQAGSRGAQA